ncbi:hypothetical protein BLNAU_5257 [Blattamonas nauphoetae]|uniref:Uncharacterized protein n=1 Tax=Blattamonas nauphoetae TaxID=2049346 RepID=A0ABQ9Y7V0_9EUKA|nr:hypothetical protein BLNAU_5257 [Blattamonas nauphoetae]
MIDRNRFSIACKRKEQNTILLYWVIRNMPHIHRHSASRLCPSQLERLLAPSVDVLSRYLIQPSDFGSWARVNRDDLIIDVCILCDQRVIARCLNRNGFFSHFVSGLLSHNTEASESFFRMIVDRSMLPKLAIDDRNKIRKTVPPCLEEGWQDALEYVYVKKAVVTRDPQFGSSQMMLFLGANMKWWAD